MASLLPDSVREIVLERITPRESEIKAQKEVIITLTNALITRAGEAGFSYSFIEPQGSTGMKQTQLHGVADIDLFVALNPSEHLAILKLPAIKRHAALDSLMSNLVSNWFEPALDGIDVEAVQRAFSQHPFLSLRMKGIDVDILGCFDIDKNTLAKEGPITAVDRTIHHTRYIAERLYDKKREDARILKSFVRACHAYGDTCAVGRMGLTGVALELLIVFNENLDSAIHSLRNLDTKPVDVCSRTLDELKAINAFQDDFLFLIDPTDTNRNIASSFSRRSYHWVQYQVDRFYEALEKENDHLVDFLIESPIPSEDIPQWFGAHSRACEFQRKEEIHYTILRDKLYRVARKIRTEMQFEKTGEERFGQILTEIVFRDGQYTLGITVEKPRISPTYSRRGPPIVLKDAASRFRKAHKKVTEIDGHLCTEAKRDWTFFEDMFKVLLDEYQVKGLELLYSKDILSRQVLNVLFRYILPIEPEFKEKITRVKETEINSSR